MAKTMCIQNFTYGVTGETFEAGVEYDVPTATLKANPDYFKSSGRPSNKMAGTDEDKSAGGDEEAVEAEAAE
jgi:hypothetical protein